MWKRKWQILCIRIVFFFFFSHIKFYFVKFSQKFSLRKYFNIAYNPWRNKYWCKSFDWTRGTRNRYTNRTFFIYSCVSHECELTNVIFFLWQFKFCCTFVMYNKQHLPQKGKYSGRRCKSVKNCREYVGSVCMRHLLAFWKRKGRIRCLVN